MIWGYIPEIVYHLSSDSHALNNTNTVLILISILQRPRLQRKWACLFTASDVRNFYTGKINISLSGLIRQEKPEVSNCGPQSAAAMGWLCQSTTSPGSRLRYRFFVCVGALLIYSLDTHSWDDLFVCSYHFSSWWSSVEMHSRMVYFTVFQWIFSCACHHTCSHSFTMAVGSQEINGDLFIFLCGFNNVTFTYLSGNKAVICLFTIPGQ